MSNSSQRTTDALDVLLLQDFTGSQIPYIESIRKGVEKISAKIQQAGHIAAEDVRYGLVAFRDHPPQDETFVTQVYPFSTKLGGLADNLASLSATGGGDGPECQACALADALNAKWREGATKVVVLITDSPPHGIGEDGDGFPNGCPVHIDPVQVATQMAKFGITLYVLACEPTLSQYYKRAWDFYVGLTKITGGRVFDLGDAKNLPDLISGTALEALQIDRLVAQYADEVHGLAKSGDLTPDAIAEKLYSELEAKEVSLHCMVVQEMHLEISETISSNIDVWFKSNSIAETRSKIQAVPGNRITDSYLSGLIQPDVKFEELSIEVDQVQVIVQKCLLRK